jgi:hypothetical protein
MFPRRLSVLLTTLLLLWGCGKSNNDNCPGLCPDETVMPTMTISTGDGSASIASAKIVGGPCAYLLIHSAGEVGAPTTYAAVQVTYNGPRDIPPMCIVELTSRSGQVETIAPQVKSREDQTNCCPYGTCCSQDGAVTAKRYHLEFDPATQTVSFPPAPDGGFVSDAADDRQDAPAAEEAHDSLAVDTSGFDLGGVDSEIDGATVDVADIDAAGVDATDEIDLAADS